MNKRLIVLSKKESEKKHRLYDAWQNAEYEYIAGNISDEELDAAEKAYKDYIAVLQDRERKLKEGN